MNQCQAVETRQQAKNRNNAANVNANANPNPTTRLTTTTTTTRSADPNVEPPPKAKDQPTTSGQADPPTTRVQQNPPPAKTTADENRQTEKPRDESLVSRINKYNNVDLGECLAYPTLTFRDDLAGMINLATTVKDKMSKTTAVNLETSNIIFIKNTLTSAEIPKDFANAHRDCNSGGGFLFRPETTLDDIQLILTRQNVIIGTEKIWVDVQYDSALKTLVFSDTGKEVPDVWSDAGIVTYPVIQPNQCATFVASPLASDDQRFVQTPCTELHKSLCQFTIDPNIKPLNALRKTAIHEISILEPRLKKLQQTFDHLTYRAKCDNQETNNNLADELLLNTPKNLIFQQLAQPNNEKASIPLLPSFIDDLQNLESFLKRFLSKPVFLSRNKEKLCQCSLKTNPIKVNVSTHVPSGLKDILKTIKKVVTRNHSVPIPLMPNVIVNGTGATTPSTFNDWLGEIALAIATGFTLITGISSIICTFCRRQENQTCCQGNPSTSDDADNDVVEQTRQLMEQSNPAPPPIPDVPQNEGFRLFRVIREKFRRKQHTDATTETNEHEQEVEMQTIKPTVPSAPPLDTNIPKLPPPPPTNPHHTAYRPSKRTYKLQQPVPSHPAQPMIARPPPRPVYTVDEMTKANTMINSARNNSITKYEIRNNHNHDEPLQRQTLPIPRPRRQPRQVYFFSMEDGHPVSLEDDSSITSSSSSGTSNSSFEIRGLDRATVRRFNESWT